MTEEIKQKEKKKLVNIGPIWATTIVQKIGLYASCFNGNDVYYLKQVVTLMINLYGEKRAVEMLKKDESFNKDILRKIGEDWYELNGFKRKLIRLGYILEKVNKYYNKLEDRRLTKKSRDKLDYTEYIQQCKYLPLIDNDLYALFVFLVENSSIRNMNVSYQFLKILDTGKKTYGGVKKERLKDEIHNLPQ